MQTEKKSQTAGELEAMREALRESEERYRTAFEFTGTAMMVVEEDTSVSMWNHKLEEVTGYTNEDAFIGRHWTEFVADEDLPRLLEYHVRRREHPASVPDEYEFRLKHKCGELRDIFMNVGLIPGTKRTLISLIDITNRKRMERTLRESEQRFRGIYSHSPIGIALFSPEGVALDMNGSFRALFKLGDGPAAPNLFEVITLDGALKHRLENGLGVGHEGAWGSGDSARWFDWNLTPLGGADQNPKTLLVQVQDITERKRSHDALLSEARTAAESANRLVENLKKEMVASFTFRNMVSRSPHMLAIFDLLPEMAQTTTTVLITGESGTGKELIARSLHDQSPRSGDPFVAINCSALPDTLLESELFGYKAGAFTDAKKDKPGRFAQAEGGTIFLDEIGDISTAMQARLLRVLQERVYQPLGGTQSVKSDVRVIAATNRDLAVMVKDGKFREDLFYRIKVLQVKLPPLRERRVDIPVLCQHFVGLFNNRFHKRIDVVAPDALALLLAHDFPGNIRELENIMEHAFVFCKGSVIEPRHLPPELSAAPVAVGAPAIAKVESFDELEKMYIEKVLAETGGHKLRAAEKLGIHKATLFRKIRRLGIE